MPRTPSPAQRAVQITFLLKGHLKNARIAYIRAAVLLAKVRDESFGRRFVTPTSKTTRRNASVCNARPSTSTCRSTTVSADSIRAIEAAIAAAEPIAKMKGLSVATLTRLGSRERAAASWPESRKPVSL